MCMCIAALSQSRRAPGLSQRRPTPAVQWPPVRAIKHGCAFLSLAVSAAATHHICATWVAASCCCCCFTDVTCSDKSSGICETSGPEEVHSYE
eukprot:772797-Pelagomonas_calceolata.AAC.1